MSKKYFLLFVFFAIFAFIAMPQANAQDDTEPTTVSSVAETVLPWNAQRILPGKVPAEFDRAFEKMLAEAGGKIAGGAREVIIWEAKTNHSKIKSELQTNFRKEGWQYETAARQGDVEFFSLLKGGAERRALMGFFVASDGVFVCALMEVKAAAAVTAPISKTNLSSPNTRATISGGLVGRWFRTVGGSVISSTGKTTLKGGEDFTFEFFADGTVEYTRKKDILNWMQCRIISLDTARGRYTLTGSRLEINFGAMKSTGTNSCNAKENYNKVLGNSTFTAQIEIKQLEDLSRPDKPLTMCFDGSSRDVCYEKQR